MAHLKLSKSRSLDVMEESLIQQGLHGGFRVMQLDKDGNPTREAIFHNSVLYIRNGGGQMRVQGMTADQHLVIRDEAWQPLRVFSGYYGERFGLEKQGMTSANGRSAIKYKLVLLPGPDLIKVEGSIDGPKKPKSLRGTLWVDAETSVPIKADFDGELDAPTELPDGGVDKGEPGHIELGLQFDLKSIEGREIKPGSYVPTIKRHPTDLEPLGFLDGGTRTSTIIGGPQKGAEKAAKPKGEEEGEEDDEEEAPAPAKPAPPSKPAKKPK
jgi:hypothetical protein